MTGEQVPLGRIASHVFIQHRPQIQLAYQPQLTITFLGPVCVQ